MHEANFPVRPRPSTPPPRTIPVAQALLVGVPRVNPALHIDPKTGKGWDGSAIAQSVVSDIRNMESHFRKQGSPGLKIHTAKLTSETETTKENIFEKIKWHANVLKSGDLFIFYFSGHGGVYLDPQREKGFVDTLSCYNDDIRDYELREIWKSFNPGVRIVMLSDSCNSGSNEALFNSRPMDSIPLVNILRVPGIGAVPKQRKIPGMGAMLIHYGACEDGKNSSAIGEGGFFTRALLKVLNDRNFGGNYGDLYQAILKETAGTKQVAQYSELGPYDTSAFEAFRKQRPFTVLFPKSLLLHITAEEKLIPDEKELLGEEMPKKNADLPQPAISVTSAGVEESDNSSRSAEQRLPVSSISQNPARFLREVKRAEPNNTITKGTYTKLTGLEVVISSNFGRVK